MNPKRFEIELEVSGTIRNRRLAETPSQADEWAQEEIETAIKQGLRELRGESDITVTTVSVRRVGGDE